MLKKLIMVMARRIGVRGSLSAHYFITTAVLAVLVAAGLWVAQVYVMKAGTVSTANIDARSHVAEYSRLLRDAVWRCEAELKAYAVSNDPADYEILRRHLLDTFSQANLLSGNEWIKLQAVASTQALVGNLRLLIAAIDQLHHLRANAKSWSNGQQDATVLKQDVQPLLDKIWNGVLSIDQSIEAAAARDLSVLTNVLHVITLGLWLLALLLLLTIGFGYVYLNRTVLRPIAQLTHALHAEAAGAEGIELPPPDKVETRELVDAFLGMRRQVHARQIALEYQALHDALTGLPNRTLLQDRLQQVVLAASRDNRPLALIMMDLDRFKEINDTLGHHVGDRVLQQVGERLAEVLRESDTVARLGGDEFALLLPNAHEQHALNLAHKIVTTLEQSFTVDHHHLSVGASLGIAIFPQHGDSAQALIQRADVAMYVAKRKNSGYALYDVGQDQHSEGRLALVNDLRIALQNGGLELHYQPKQNIRSGKLTGFEALLRWRHPHRGHVTPDEIIPIAEQTGLIKPLTHWVMNTALAQCAAWQRAGLELTIAVNLSVWNLHDRDFDQVVAGLLAQWEVPAQYLELEITESAMVADPDMEMLNRLHAIGVRLAVDDYGTGFSSLAYLKSMPLTDIKIDKSFVTDMTVDDNDAVIVRSTIDLAHNLGRKVVAEGVETKEIWDLLEILRCDTAQGYYISPPIPAADLDRWIAESPWGISMRLAVRA